MINEVIMNVSVISTPYPYPVRGSVAAHDENVRGGREHPGRGPYRVGAGPVPQVGRPALRRLRAGRVEPGEGVVEGYVVPDRQTDHTDQIEHGADDQQQRPPVTKA